MSDLIDALRGKISALDDEIEELEDVLQRARIRRETYQELLAEETEESAPESETPRPKKRGRPKGSKNRKKKATLKKDKKVKDTDPEQLALYEEAVALGGEAAKTDPELAERLKNRFHAFPRSQQGYGTVKVGSEKSAPENQSNATISMPDDLTEEEDD